MLNKRIIEIITDAYGEIILNCEFCGQLALKIRDNKFVVMDLPGDEWIFERFEQMAYFMVMTSLEYENECFKYKSFEECYKEALEFKK